MNHEGKIVNQAKMSNERVLSYLSSFKVDRVAMESSNQVASLYRKLTKEGYTVLVSHPKKTRYIAEAKIKSDRVDSKAIAELLRLDALPLAYMPDKETAVLREKVRRRAFLVRERVKLRVKVKAILTYEGIKWPSDHGLFTAKGVEWLHGLSLDPVESYLRVMASLDDEIKLLSKQLLGQA
jgi:transposase